MKKSDHHAALPQISQRIFSNADLPAQYAPARYRVGARVFTLSKRMRQTLDLLLTGPLHCASPIRFSHYVDLLRDDYGLKIETVWHTTAKPFPSRFGIYHLHSDLVALGNVAGSNDA